MPERGIIKVAVDCDGPVVGVPNPWRVDQRMLKMGLKPTPGVDKGLNQLNADPNAEVMGIYTARYNYGFPYRGLPFSRVGQTRSLVARHELPVDTIIHTPKGSRGKIERVLLDAHSLPPPRSRPMSSHEVGVHSQQEGIEVVLIDDKVNEVAEAALGLAVRREYSELLRGFTVAAFGHSQEVEALSVPGVIHVVSMKGWDDTGAMLEKVRSRTR